MTDYRDSYQRYVREYLKAEASQQSKGYDMRLPMYSYQEFKAYRQYTYNDLKAEVKAGQRKRVGNVEQEMIRFQRYAISQRQARAQREAYTEYAERQRAIGITPAPFREEAFKSKDPIYADFRAQLSKDYKALREMGYTSKEARQEISFAYFGSK